VSAAVARPVRVAYFVPPSEHFAGIERVVHEIATGLAADAGLQVSVIYASSYDEAVLSAPRYDKHVLRVDRLRQLFLALRRCVAANSFDVLVCPQVEASVIGWLATRGLGVRCFVSHLHGNPRLEERDGTRRTRLAFAVYRRLLARRLSAVFAVSESLRRYAETTLTPATPTFFLRNPVRPLPVAAHTDGDASGFRFLSVGRLSRQKGQDLLLRAFAIVRRDLPTARLVLVGKGDAAAELRSLAADLGLTEAVEFAGYSSDPSGAFAATDCFVLPSRWEGFGMVLLEALQFGLPLVAADCEFGPADLITDPAIGELVPVEDPEALARAMIRASRRPADPDAAAARREVAAGFRPAVVIAEHRAVLLRLAGRAGLRSPEVPVPA
jgi:glycosyltransferase involved in cell wall biosynthesis